MTTRDDDCLNVSEAPVYGSGAICIGNRSNHKFVQTVVFGIPPIMTSHQIAAILFPLLTVATVGLVGLLIVKP